MTEPAWARRKSRQLSRARTPAGGTPACRRILATVGCRDADADTGEFTDDPLVAPARVLAREPQHQRTELLGDRRSRRPPSRTRPPFPHKLAMPTQQRVRADEERPALSTQQLAGRSKEDAVT